MNPKDEKTLTIAQRTRKNLEFMDEQFKAGAKVYEFTQLFNSMLGMIVCIREEYYKGLQRPSEPSVTWNEVQKLGLSASPSLQSKAGAFSTLISSVRNAFAHSLFDFESDQNGKIVGVRVWNGDRPPTQTWTATFSEQELRELAYLAIDYLLRMFHVGPNFGL